MLKEVLNSIEKLNRLVENSIESGQFSLLDKDLLKSKVRELYEDIIFIDCYDKEDELSTFYFGDPHQEEQDEEPCQQLEEATEKVELSVASFDSEDESITVEITQEESQEENIEIEEEEIKEEEIEEKEGATTASFESEDESITVEITQEECTEEETEQIEETKQVEETEQIEETEEVEEVELESYDELYRDFTPTPVLNSTEEEHLIIETEQAEVVVYEAPLEYSLSDLISPSDRERIIGSLFSDSDSRLEALILKVDAAEDFDSAIITLQDSDIDHSSEDMRILVDALEKRFI